jgi:hypothetical protein
VLHKSEVSFVIPVTESLCRAPDNHSPLITVCGIGCCWADLGKGRIAKMPANCESLRTLGARAGLE